MIQYNKCNVCGADGGRCGMLIKTEKFPKHVCMNCYDTWNTGNLVIHSYLGRTKEELEKTADLLKLKDRRLKIEKIIKV